jgi:hypothetical protein
MAGGELGEHDGPLGVAGNRAGQPFEAAGGEDGVLAAEVLEDALLGAAVLADGLDQVEVGPPYSSFPLQKPVPRTCRVA